MTWRAALEGHSFDLDLLVREFTGARARVVCDDDGAYWLESASFEDLPDANAVWTAARALLAVVNGAAKLAEESHRAVRLQGHISDGSGVYVFANVADTIRVRALAPTIQVRDANGELLQHVAPTPPRGPSLLQVADGDSAVREVLELLADDHPGWVTLYKVKEIVHDDTAGGIHQFATAAEITAFGASANRPDISGSDARHARMGGAPPRRSMTLGEGRAFIRRIAEDWITSKRAP